MLYLKATPIDSRASTFVINDDEVTTGRLTYHSTLIGEQIITDLDLEPSSTVMRFLADEEAPTFHNSDGKGWELMYAYWWDWEKGFLRLVVTTGSLYVMGENGKTIDRV